LACKQQPGAAAGDPARLSLALALPPDTPLAAPQRLEQLLPQALQLEQGAGEPGHLGALAPLAQQLVAAALDAWSAAAERPALVELLVGGSRAAARVALRTGGRPAAPAQLLLLLHCVAALQRAAPRPQQARR
jgi:hypothetical protein